MSLRQFLTSIVSTNEQNNTAKSPNKPPEAYLQKECLGGGLFQIVAFSSKVDIKRHNFLYPLN